MTLRMDSVFTLMHQSLCSGAEVLVDFTLSGSALVYP
jgi:hypothetical protein